MVGDGDAVGVARQIMQHVLGAAEGRPGIEDPVLSIKRAQRGASASPHGAACTRRRSAADGEQRAAAIRRRTRKTRLSTLTGSRKLEREVIQRAWSVRVRRQHAVDVGMWVSVCPQVCRMDKPSCAPRCADRQRHPSSAAALVQRARKQLGVLPTSVASACGLTQNQVVVASER
jgi:hypothetical protein